METQEPSTDILFQDHATVNHSGQKSKIENDPFGEQFMPTGCVVVDGMTLKGNISLGQTVLLDGKKYVLIFEGGDYHLQRSTGNIYRAISSIDDHQFDEEP